MKKLITIVLISLVVFACSHKTTTTATKTTVMKTESATVTNAQYLEGKAVYEASCGRCHKLFSPDKGNMTQWTKWLNAMAPKAKLTDEQKTQVTNYISVNALPN